MHRLTLPLFFLISLSMIIWSCSESTSIPEKPIEFRKLDFNYLDNSLGLPIQNEAAILGRVLFYDNILSKNGNLACASCHKQEFAFGDNVALSEGFLGGHTLRNTPILLNNALNHSFFWDGRERGLKASVIQPIFDDLEMGLSERELVSRISATNYYDELYNDAFPGERVTLEGISFALTQFVASMVSADSKFDRTKSSTSTFDTQESKGFEIFMEHCNSCHNVSSVRADGLADDDFYGGSGEELISIGLAQLDGSLETNTFFRVPSLRNLASSAPYMHDGRFATLEEVIEHYDTEIAESGDLSQLDHRLFDDFGRPKRLDLTDAEKTQLIAFLLSLHDYSIEQDPKFSNPFVL